MILERERIPKGDRFIDSVQASRDEYRLVTDKLLTIIKNHPELGHPIEQEANIRSHKDIGIEAFESGLAHFRGSIDVRLAMSPSFKDVVGEINKSKQFLHRNVHSRPPDLSRFYSLLRGKGGIMFGDVVDNAIRGMYAVQNPMLTTFFSQVIYADAMSRVLFPEVKYRRTILDKWAGREFGGGILKRLDAARPGTEGDTKQVSLIRMLQEDFDTLALIQIAKDYALVTDPSSYKFANEDMRALNAVSTLISRMRGIKDGDVILDSHQSSLSLIQIAMGWAHRAALDEARSEEFFTNENAEKINELFVPDWDKVNFSREVLSCERLFFEEGTNPLFVCVDPVPSKAYLAAVAVTNLRWFMKIEDSEGSAGAARSIIAPLSRPFSDLSYLENTLAFAFYVRKGDGELYMYGDSNQLARAALGKRYDICKKLIQHSIYNIVNADYTAHTPQEANQAGASDSPRPPQDREIPSQPIPRYVPPAARGEPSSKRAFYGRGPHNRALPPGWKPRHDAWKEASDNRENITLYAEFYERPTDAEPIAEIELDYKDSYKEFRAQLEELYRDNGDNIRFQTYVKESPKTTK